ncbi:hypothetical protein GC194_15750 [bacterium]|nr:hypothetical protein [bacterium]
MKQIDLHNYEAWLLDYFEGNLCHVEKEILIAFLTQHPELKEDLDEWDEIPELAAHTIPFEAKATLYKKVAIDINEATLDDFIIADLEGTLDAESRQQLHAYLALHPQAEKTAQLYSKTRLPLDEHLTFPNKNRLKKRPALYIPTWVKYAAAAAVLLLAIVYLFTNNQLETQVAVGPKVAPEKQIISPKKTEYEATEHLAAEETLATENPQTNEVAHLSGNDADENNEPLNAPAKQLAVSYKVQKIEPIKLQQLEVQTPEVIDTNNLKMAFAIINQQMDTLSSPKASPASNLRTVGIWEFAGLMFKENVLGEIDPADGILRESDFARAFAGKVKKASNNKSDYDEKNKGERVTYTFRIGNFGFSRSVKKRR